MYFQFLPPYNLRYAKSASETAILRSRRFIEALYPSLDSKRVARMVSEAIMMSKVTWLNVDYLEACRYIALNWSADQCRRSKLRRVLPTEGGLQVSGLG